MIDINTQSRPRRWVIWLMLAVMLVLSLLFGAVNLSPAAAQCAPRADWLGVHTVQRGETMFRIARQYGISAWDLALGNCISNPNRIYAGQRLRVPGGGNPGNPGNPGPRVPLWVRVRTEGAELRSAPNPSAPTVAILAVTTAVEVLARTADNLWLKVNVGGYIGYMYAFTTEIQPEQLVGVPVDGVPGPIVTPNPPGMVTVSDNWVRFRSAPNFGNNIMGYLFRGNTLYAVGRDTSGQWIRVQTHMGVYGWVNAPYLIFDRALLNALPVLA